MLQYQPLKIPPNMVGRRKRRKKKSTINYQSLSTSANSSEMSIINDHISGIYQTKEDIRSETKDYRMIINDFDSDAAGPSRMPLNEIWSENASNYHHAETTVSNYANTTIRHSDYDSEAKNSRCNILYSTRPTPKCGALGGKAVRLKTICSSKYFAFQILRTLLIHLCLLAQFSGSVNSIGCFVCSSFNGSNAACEDVFNSTVDRAGVRGSIGMYQFPCWSSKKNRKGLFPADHCVKVSGYQSDDPSKTMIIRTCALDSGTLTADTEIVRVSHCGHFKYDGSQYTGCVQACDTDGCNGATAGQQLRWRHTLFFPLFFLLFFVIF